MGYDFNVQWLTRYTLDAIALAYKVNEIKGLNRTQQACRLPFNVCRLEPPYARQMHQPRGIHT